ncbi:TonB-dependent siderophore receptor [Brevundimonas sp.]|uniref:TonB-dependent siderophore receptor n=1 Tax=Brevundimonas sp. TaxID=1871086 RepID=UPI003D0A27EC
MRGAMMALAVAASSVAVTSASAQSAGGDREISVSITSRSLSDALRQLAEVSGLQLVYDTRITDGKTAPAVSGTMTTRAALASVLAGSGLSFQFSGDRTAIITGTTAAGTAAGPDDGVREVGIVNVEGVAGLMPFGDVASPINGVNGSRDVQATEGTGSYTTGAVAIASKIPQTLRETAASVSVITSQQIQDQGLITARDILEKITGVTVTTAGNSEEFQFFSRGFAIETYTVDGGAPLLTGINNRPILDMSQYDSIQLVRGAEGLFGGYGDPGGTINLIRKKPLDHNQITYDQAIGSWNNFREQFDITGPLTDDGRLRGRFVAARTDRDYFYDVAEGHKTSVYGVVDYDLTPETLLTVGANYIRERNIPNNGGLPRYQDGTAIDFPRSTCFCVPFSYDDVDRTEVFATVDHSFSENWSSRLNINYGDQDTEALYYTSGAAIFPSSTAPSGSLSGYFTRNPVRQLAVDFSTSGKFNLFGREQGIVVGASSQAINSDGGETLFYPSRSIPNIFAFDPGSYTEPPRPGGEPEYASVKGRRNIYSAYANLNLELIDNLNATVGLRWNSFLDNVTSREDSDFDPSTPNTIVTRGKIRERSFQDPTIGLTYDFLSNFTAYATYQSIYRPQTQDNARASLPDEPLPPITGFNQEAGLKWESPSGRLNASLAAYSTEQNGFVTANCSYPPPDYNQVCVGTSPIVRDYTSEGVDVEVAGEVIPGLQVSLGYTYNDNRLVENGGQTDRRKSSYTPRNLFKSWVSYRPQEGRFDRFIFGGGVQWQSSAFFRGFVCTLDSAQAACDYSRPFVPLEYTTDAYATYSARIGYRLTDRVEIGLNGENLSDVNTYDTNPNQNTYGYNYYIEPRSFMVSLRARW